MTRVYYTQVPSRWRDNTGRTWKTNGAIYPSKDFNIASDFAPNFTNSSKLIPCVHQSNATEMLFDEMGMVLIWSSVLGPTSEAEQAEFITNAP